MTGAACCWTFVVVLFGILTGGLVIAFCVQWYDNGFSDAVKVLACAFLSAALCFVAGLRVEASYDVNFAVAMKNIQYNVVVTSEKNVDIQMDYKDVKAEEQKK